LKGEYLKMKKLSLFTLILLSVLLLTSFTLTVFAEPVTIEVWFHSGKGEEREVLDAQVEEFNAMQNEVVVEPVQLPEGSYNEQVSAASLAGDLPDLLDFDDLIRISAITAAGRDALLARIIELLPEGPLYYPDGQITATYEREIAEDLIRAAALHHLREEVPYGVFVWVNDYRLREENLRYIHATIFVERESQKGIVIGKGGSMIKAISTMARQEIETMSGEKVFLELQVKVEKNWRDNPEFLQRYGLSHE